MVWGMFFLRQGRVVVCLLLSGGWVVCISHGAIWDVIARVAFESVRLSIFFIVMI